MSVTLQLRRSLRRFITFDQVACLAAVGVILGVHLTVHPSPYFLVLAAMVGAAAGVMGLGRRPLAAGDVGRAVIWVAVANWGVALGATAIATFCVPITVVAAMLPGVLAVPYVEPRTLWRINAASIAVSTLAVALGVLQDFSGLTGSLDPWLPDSVLLAFVPFVAGLVTMVSTHNSARLARALTDTLDANDRLRSSEKELRDSRARLVAAIDGERRRIARDLHDGSQQRLVSLALGLRRARRVMLSDPGGADALLARLNGELAESMAEVRDLTRGVYPPVLTNHGLRASLLELAGRAPGQVALEVGPLPRYAPEVEASVYWSCMEALQNCAKHAGEEAAVLLRVVTESAGQLTFHVEDDGPGFDPARVAPGQGLTNMADRMGAVGGLLTVWSAPGRGVRVHGTVPSPRAARADDRGTASAPWPGGNGARPELGRRRDCSAGVAPVDADLDRTTEVGPLVVRRLGQRHLPGPLGLTFS